MILSLCSGIGALDYAVERLTGERVALYAEKDLFASRVLARRFPRARNLGDIAQVDWQAVAVEHPGLSTIVAGFPCQNISLAGPRDGISGKRSAVWKHVVDAVRHVRPERVFLENVPGIRTRGLSTVAGDLAEIRYDLRWVRVRASDIGAPHRRDRWFALATPQNANGQSGD